MIMDYFDDLGFIDGGIVPRCRVSLDQRFAGLYSLEFKLGGRLALGRDGGPASVHAGAVAFWHHPRHSYQYGPARPEGYWEHHWVTFRGERGRRLVEQGLEPLAPAGWLAVAQPGALAAAFRDLVPLVQERDPRRHGEAVLLLERLLVLLAGQARAGAEGADRAVLAVAEAVRADPFRAWDWAREARGCGLSLSHFRRRFRQATGRPPHAWLLARRMQEAARRLGQGRQPVASVAAACGYDPQRFSRLFRQVIGLPPRTYRDHLPVG
jgi:AraC-like DNA-binding protein